MAILTHKCPHCLTEHIALVVVASTERGRDAVLHLLCPKCILPSSSLLEVTSGYISPRKISKQSGEARNYGYMLKEFWPSPPEPNIPHYLPPDVVLVYLQAERNFPISGNEEAAGTMYRKALDIGLKKIDPSLSGMLGPRIKKLADAGKLTEDIQVWSNAIRDVGNEAAHEESSISRDELIELRNFSEMVLRYLFSLPNAVRKRRGETLEWEDAPNI